MPQGGEGHGEEDEGGMQGNFWHLIGRAPRMLHKTKGFLAQNISSAKVENPNVQHHAYGVSLCSEIKGFLCYTSVPMHKFMHI